jgi:hypothetical protein
MNILRKGLPPLPDRMKALPIEQRGYPVPWFVGTFEGKRDFRVADQHKRVIAVKDKLCWVCGGKLGRHLAFVIGPMCAVNHNTSEPPSHRECALFAAQACPFLILPKSDYRKPPEGGTMLPGSLGGNPGVCCVWITRTYRPYKVEDSWLIRIGPAEEVLWYAEGKPATREQVLESLERRLPALESIAKEEGERAQAALAAMVAETMELLPSPRSATG